MSNSRRQPRSRVAPGKKVVVFVAWFRREDWARWRELVADPERFAGTIDDWFAGAKAARQKFEWQGKTVKTIVIEPEDFAAWCAERGRPLDAGHRSAFAVFKGTEGKLDPTRPRPGAADAPSEQA